MKHIWPDEDLIEHFTLTPLVYQHITPYGTFDLDLSTRIPLLPVDQEEVA